MQRGPKKTKDADTNGALDFIYQNAFGNPILFTAAPTLAQMKANTWGFFGTTIYIKFANNTGISIAGANLT